MRHNSIAYANLRAEMARIGLTIRQMAIELNKNRDTLARKLSRKSPLTLEEAFLIQRRYFPEISVFKLFEEDNQSNDGDKKPA